MGVRRAVDLASAEAGRAGGQSVYTLGPLIHNPDVLADLENRGVKAVDEPPSADGAVNSGVLIIRAHGISPEIEKKLRNGGFRVVDATCPKVKASQLKVKELADAGYCLFLAGEAEHAEIAGISGYAKDAPFCAVVGGAEEAEKAALRLLDTGKDVKTALWGQTTISPEEYEIIGAAVKKHFPNLEVIDTICAAAADRRQALRELLNQADAVIIAGGEKSANTRRLLSAAQESGKPCALVEKASKIPPVFRSYGVVGISAGASTPDSVIDEIERELMKI